MINCSRPVVIVATVLALGGGSAMAQFGGLFDPPRPPSNVPVRPPPPQPSQPPPPTQLAPQPLPPPGPPGRIQSEELPAPGAPSASPRGGNTAVTALPSGPAGPGPAVQRGPRAATPAPPTAAALPAQPAALAPPPEDTPIPPPAQKIANPKAVFAGLDKITGRITAFDAAIGETVQFGALQVTARACYSRPPTETPLTDGFVEVDEVTLQGEVRRIFTGWMFAASPGLHAVEHAIYDVWLTDCKGGAPPVADVAAAPAPAPVAARPAAPASRPAQSRPQPAPAPPQRQAQPQSQPQPGGTWLQPGPAR
jgi:hypothetical protein